jgi:hypothetical protein
MTLALLLFVALLQAPAPGAAAEHRVRGVVSDESGAVLPGVTVVANGADGSVLASGVTDGTGKYVLGPLGGRQVQLTFRLDGFAPVIVTVAIADGDAIANPRLLVAPRSETVDVVGRIPLPPPPPPPVPPVRPRPRPVMWTVPDHDPAAVCGPAKIESAPEAFGTIRARRYAANGLYGAGDELTIDGGIASGVGVGAHFVVRRSYEPQWGDRLAAEHTAGLVQIVAADDTSAVAVVIYACDEMLPGDRLAAFHPEPRRPVPPEGKPDFRRPAKILFLDTGRLIGAPRSLLVIDRGAVAGVCAGQRVTLFRRRASRREPIVVGDAIVVAVRAHSATIRIEHATDAVLEGDEAALQQASGVCAGR